MPFRIHRIDRLLIEDGSGTVHEISEVFPRLEQERSGVIPLKHFVNNRAPEKISEKIRDGIPLPHPCSGHRRVVRIPFQADEEMIEITEFPTRFQADAVLDGTFNPFSQSKLVKQEREIHSRPDRQIQGTPEPCIDLDQLGPILRAVPLELDHRDPMPAIEGYQLGGGGQRLGGRADAFAKNADPS